MGPIGRYEAKSWATRFLAAVEGRWPRHQRPRVVVLSYHSVHPTSSIACATPDLLSEHLRWLATECHCVPFSEILESASTDGKPVVAVTFDDGYADNHEHALPLLLEWGIPATFFVTTGLVSGERWVADRFRSWFRCSYDEVRPMTWSQVGEIKSAGMEVGAHTYRHPNLARLSHDDVRAEFARSKATLEDRLGAEVTAMSYPFGKPHRHVTPDVVRIAGEAGFERAAIVLHRGVKQRDEALAIPRFTIASDSLSTLKARIGGAFDVVGFGQERGPLWTARLVSPEDFELAA